MLLAVMAIAQVEENQDPVQDAASPVPLPMPI
jgi:hypothetical protein